MVLFLFYFMCVGFSSGMQLELNFAFPSFDNFVIQIH
uniref:Uncharacterized protein n=1 Tax=Rhizophora mucronata TaxID=61149 RepID=A0A2P2MZJ7_RHIMU